MASSDHDDALHDLGNLNPQLAQSRFCPRCAAPAEIDFPRTLSCPACGFLQYANPKPVACLIPCEPDGRVWLIRRGQAPSAGLWTFPGGFVDLGESVEEAALREVQEEVEAGSEIDRLVGVYSRPQDRVILVVFAGRLLGPPRTTEEATELRLCAVDEIPWDELAFWSTEQALRDLLSARV